MASHQLSFGEKLLWRLPSSTLSYSSRLPLRPSCLRDPPHLTQSTGFRGISQRRRRIWFDRWIRSSFREEVKSRN